MLSILLNEFPELMGIIKSQLIKYVAYAEKKYNATQGSYWYRFFRPEDSGLGGTTKVYYATFNNGAEENFLALGAAITVPTANAYVSFGWYCDMDFTDAGYLRVKKQNIIKSEILARAPYESVSPKYLYLDFDGIIFGQQQESLDFIAYNGFGADQIGFCWPFMFRIASKSALNLE